MKIFHNGCNNFILTDQASQSFTVLSDIVRFNTRDNGESLFGATLDGGFFAKFDNSTTLQTISGGVQIDGDLVFGGSGNGVNLGVTSNTDSNTLDDYEEGTFSLTMSSTTLTTTQSESQYTKIGRVVVFYIDLAISAGSDGTAFGASSMPFTADNDKDQQVNTQTSSTNTPVLFVKGGNLNSVKSNATANLSYTDVNSKFLRVNGTYQLDS